MKTAQEVLQHFQVLEENGLSEERVKSLREQYGRNGKAPYMSRVTQDGRAKAASSTSGRPSHADMGAYTRAVQGPAGYHLARIRGSVVCAGTFRRWRRLDGVCGSGRGMTILLRPWR